MAVPVEVGMNKGIELLCPSCRKATLSLGNQPWMLECPSCHDLFRLARVMPSEEEIRAVYRLAQQEIWNRIPEAKRGRSRKSGRKQASKKPMKWRPRTLL